MMSPYSPAKYVMTSLSAEQRRLTPVPRMVQSKSERALYQLSKPQRLVSVKRLPWTRTKFAIASLPTEQLLLSLRKESLLTTERTMSSLQLSQRLLSSRQQILPSVVERAISSLQVVLLSWSQVECEILSLPAGQWRSSTPEHWLNSPTEYATPSLRVARARLSEQIL
jgi:hypothetical protein